MDTQRTLKPYPAADTQPPGWHLGAIFRRPIWAGSRPRQSLAAVALGALSLQYRTELDGLTAYRNGVVEVLEEAARPGAQLAVLSAPEDPAGPTGLATVGADGSVAMIMRDLDADDRHAGLRGVAHRGRGDADRRRAASRSATAGQRRSRPPTRRSARA